MKKIFLLIATTFIVFFACTSVVFAKSGTSDLQEKVTFLKNLEILDDAEETDFSEPVSRRNFALYIARMLRIDEYKKANKRYYIDITEDDLAWNVVAELVDRNILTVGSDNKFRPNDTIKSDEAACVLVKLLGANVNEYENYINIANSIDIINKSKGIEMKFSDVVSALYNSLNARTFTGFGAIYNGGAAISQSVETLMEQLFNLYYVKGVVNSVNHTTIDGKGGSANKIRIGDLSIPYETDDLDDLYDYLGTYSSVYYYADKKEPTKLFMIYRSESRNDITEIDAADFLGFDESKYIIKYEENITKNIKLAKNVTVILNGNDVTSIKSAFESFNKGKLKVINTSGSDTADIVIIDSYYNIVVQSIGLEDKKIYGKNAEVVDIDESNYDAFIVTDAQGNEVALKDIVADDVLSVYSSDNFMKIVISKETVFGKVEELEFEDDGYAVINGKKFRIDSELIKRINPSTLTISEIKCFLDANGIISDISNASSEETQFGYIMRVKFSSREDRTKIKLFMQSGEAKEYLLSEKCKIDGELCKTFEAANNLLERGNAAVTGQLVTVKLNSQDEITRIDTAYCNYRNEFGLYEYADGSYATYGSSMFGPKILLSGDTRVFLVPKDSNEVANIEAYKITNTGFFSAWSTYTATAYRVGDGKEIAPADVLIVPYDLIGGNSSSELLAMYVIKKVSERYDEDLDEIVEVLTLCSGTKEVEYVATQNYSPKDDDNCVPGNVVFLNLNPVNRVTSLNLIYGIKKDGTRVSNPIRTNDWGTDQGVVFLGHVSKFDNGYFELVDDSREVLITISATGVPITLVKEYNSQDVIAGSVADISAALHNHSTVAVCVMRGNIYGITVVN